jgi:hypothetical protein
VNVGLNAVGGTGTPRIGDGRDEAEAGEPQLEEISGGLYTAITRLVRMLREVGSAGLGPGAVAALGTLSRQGEMPIEELARREGVSLLAVSRIVAGLEQGGYVVRSRGRELGRETPHASGTVAPSWAVPDRPNRPDVRIMATPAGEQLAGGVEAVRSDMLHRRLEALTGVQRQAVIDAVPALLALCEEGG